MANQLSPEAVAEILLSIKAITINMEQPYRYTSGILSPCYSDMRLLVSYPKERRQVIAAWVEMIKDLGQFDLIAATATAGIPHGAWVSDALDLPMVYVRDKAKAHGKQSQIEGLAKKGQKTVITEDLISTGMSSIGTAIAIREAGGIVDTITAIYNYTMPASAKNFAEAGLELKSLTTFPVVVEVATTKGLIKPKEREIVLDWIKDPTEWGKRHGFEK